MSADNTPKPIVVPTSNKRASHIRNLWVWEKPTPVMDSVVLITGAASGIARALSLVYASRGCKLVLCDFNKAELVNTLQQCRKIRQSVRPAQYTSILEPTSDQTQSTTTPTALSDEEQTALLTNDHFVVGTHTDVTKEDQCYQFVNFAVQRFEVINVLILCAGIGAHNVFENSHDLSLFRRCIDINYYGYLYCTHAAFPHLMKSRGVLTAITSFSGEVGLPYRSAYCASKFAVTGLLESLRAEMQDIGGEKFDIVIVCPPTVNTNLRANSLTSDPALKEKHENSKSADANTGGMTVDDCASCIVDATDRRLRKAFFPLGSAIASYLRPLIPSLTDKQIYSKARL